MVFLFLDDIDMTLVVWNIFVHFTQTESLVSLGMKFVEKILEKGEIDGNEDNFYPISHQEFVV